MKQYLQYFFFSVIMLSVAASCKKDDADIQTLPNNKIIQSSILGVNGPTSGTVKQELTFNILLHLTDTTQKFDHFTDSTFNHIKIIRLFSSSKGRDSTLVDKASNTITYKFNADTAGTYYLKFYKPDNSDKTAIIDTVYIK